jgi:pyruvate dehydrogenase E2 component (dihydrolipoamide acetyltransferase)
MRATIARRLVESKNTVPHFYLEVEVDAAPLLALRETLNKRLAESAAEAGLKLSVNDFILKASAEALRRVPAVNASWAGTSIRQHSAVHLAFGVALEDGLVTPVIRDAHSKSLRDIAVDAKALIAKARSKKLSPAEMSGSTFTVTNLGMFGVTGFYGIINTPNAAILSVGATIKKPVVDAHDRVVIGQRMAIGLSGDHRVVDGANGAQFLQALKQILEEPTLILI